MVAARCSTRRSVARGQTCFGRAGELGEKQQHVALERQSAAGAGQHAQHGVGIGGVPAGKLDVVVLLVVRIPTQHHIAEANALVERREEFFAVDVLAAQDAVVVEDADLDVMQPALLDDRARLRGGSYLFGQHLSNS